MSRGSTVPSDVPSAVKRRLESEYAELLRVMRDLATPPIFMFSDHRPRLVGALKGAVAGVAQWRADQPQQLDQVLSLIPDFLRHPDEAQTLLEAATWADFFTMSDEVFADPTADDPVILAAPDLLKRTDDGLLILDGLDAQPHGLLHGELSVHYHQLLRRSFASSVNYELIGTLLGIADSNDVQARLAIDTERVRARAEHEEIFERDYWYGPPISEDALDDPHLVGEAVHGDPDEGTSILNPYAATSFRWTSDRGLKTLEIEELMPVADGDENELVLARYLHAIRDIEQKSFVHVDGAVKAYMRSGYPVRCLNSRPEAVGSTIERCFDWTAQLERTTGPT